MRTGSSFSSLHRFSDLLDSQFCLLHIFCQVWTIFPAISMRLSVRLGRSKCLKDCRTQHGWGRQAYFHLLRISASIGVPTSKDSVTGSEQAVQHFTSARVSCDTIKGFPSTCLRASPLHVIRKLGAQTKQRDTRTVTNHSSSFSMPDSLFPPSFFLVV